MKKIDLKGIKNCYRFSRVKFGWLLALFTASILINGCANFKSIDEIKALDIAQLEPQVKFVDDEPVKVKKSKIKAVATKQVIDSYNRLLDRGDPAIRREALHYLADLYMQLAENQLVSEEVQNLEDKSSSTNASFAKAIGYYQMLLSDFPEDPQKDQFNYQLARAHSLNADPESSLKTLDQIATKHVDSPSYFESQFRRGESYFVRKDYEIAKQAYSEVIKNGINTDFYQKALYKRGWSYFKLSLYPQAQADFFKLYQQLLPATQAVNGDTPLAKNVFNNDLLADTLRVISLTFYNLDGADSVETYFATHGHQAFEDKIYQALAQLYVKQERFQDAADTYLRFIANNGLSLSAPGFHSEAIDIYRRGGFPSLILPAKESFVVNYGRNGQFWRTYDGEANSQLKNQLRDHLDDISTYYHAQAQKTDKAKDYIVAAEWYGEILVTFQEPKLDSKFRFLMAETLSAGGRINESAVQYELVAYRNPPGDYSRDAGYRALLAHQAIIYPANYSLTQKLLPSIKSGLQFSTRFNHDPKSPEILARVAEQQLSINDIQGAIDASEKLLLLPAKPTSKQISRARIIIANGLFDLKQYAKAQIAFSALLVAGNLTSAQQNLFRQRRVESIYQLADAAKINNQPQQAIELFLKVKSLEPASTIAINAHYDAATLLLQTKQWQPAADLLVEFRQSYPLHALSMSIPEKLAFIYEEQKNWNKAAEEYRILAQNQTDPELAREGFWRVAQLYQKAENQLQAISAYKYYAWTYPAPYSLAQEARYHLVQLYVLTGDAQKAYFWRQKIVDFYAENSASNNNRTAFLAAESQYIISEPLYEKFKKIKLKLPLAKSLKNKRSAMKAALAAYNAVANYNVAKFTTASTHKVATIYKILSDDLMASQRPKGLDEDELEEYQYLLEDQALPFEDKAIVFYEANAKRTANQIYDESIKASMAALTKLKPVQYDKNEQIEDLVDVQF